MRSLIMSLWEWLDSFLPGDQVSVPDVTSTISTLAIVIGGGWTIWMLRREIANLEKTNRASHYSELDRTYTDILLQALERPYLRDREKIQEYVEWWSNPAYRPRREEGKNEAGADDVFVAEAQSYGTYAFIAMNFVETIRDRCVESTTSVFPFGILKTPDKLLTKTWQPIIASEIQMHGDWFRIESEPWCRNKPVKFCLGFCDFVWREEWRKNDATLWEDRSEADIRKGTSTAKRLCQTCESDSTECDAPTAKRGKGGQPSSGRKRAAIKAGK